MNLERILLGEEKNLWVDTGNRGSIYLNLYEAFLNMIDYSRPAEVVNSEITNLIQGIDGILIASRGSGTSPQVIKAIKSKQWTNANEVSEYLSKFLYFNEYLTAKRATLLAFKEFLENLLGKLPQTPESQVVATAKPAAAIPLIKLNQLKIPKLKGGEHIEMPSGKVLQYIKPGGDLNRKNLIWIGEWVVIDSGSTSSNYTPQEALNRYYENISSRWAKDLNTTVAQEFRRALEE